MSGLLPIRYSDGFTYSVEQRQRQIPGLLHPSRKHFIDILWLLLEFRPTGARRSESFHERIENRLLDFTIAQAAAAKTVCPVRLLCGITEEFEDREKHALVGILRFGHRSRVGNDRENLLAYFLFRSKELDRIL